MLYTSPLIADARNKLGGVVFSRSRGQTTIRSRVAPLQPRTQAQAALRVGLSSASAAWSRLTQPTRDAYAAFAATVSLSDAVGHHYAPSGYQVFVTCFRNLRLVGLPPPTVPPSPGAPAHALAYFDTTSAWFFGVWFGLNVNVPTGSGPGTAATLIANTPPLTQGVGSVDRTRFRTFAPPYPIIGGQYNFNAAYFLRFGRPAIGSNVWTSVRLIDRTTGWSGATSTRFCQVVG